MILDLIDRARERANKLKPAESKQLRTAVAKLRRKPLARIRGKRFDRVQAVQDAVLNLFRANGHAAEVAAATDRFGAIDWEKLIELFIKYAPQILAIVVQILTLF